MFSKCVLYISLIIPFQDIDTFVIGHLTHTRPFHHLYNNLMALSPYHEVP